MDRIHVFLGTKAQYIKTAPLLRLMDERGVDYRLIDSGQHARLSAGPAARARRARSGPRLGGDPRHRHHRPGRGGAASAAAWATRARCGARCSAATAASASSTGTPPPPSSPRSWPSGPGCAPPTSRRGCAATGCCTPSRRSSSGWPSCGSATCCSPRTSRPCSTCGSCGCGEILPVSANTSSSSCATRCPDARAGAGRSSSRCTGWRTSPAPAHRPAGRGGRADRGAAGAFVMHGPTKAVLARRASTSGWGRGRGARAAGAARGVRRHAGGRAVRHHGRREHPGGVRAARGPDPHLEVEDRARGRPGRQRRAVAVRRRDGSAPSSPTPSATAARRRARRPPDGADPRRAARRAGGARGADRGRSSPPDGGPRRARPVAPGWGGRAAPPSRTYRRGRPRGGRRGSPRGPLGPSSLWLDDAWAALVSRADGLGQAAGMGLTAPGLALLQYGLFRVVPSLRPGPRPFRSSSPWPARCCSTWWPCAAGSDHRSRWSGRRSCSPRRSTSSTPPGSSSTPSTPSWSWRSWPRPGGSWSAPAAALGGPHAGVDRCHRPLGGGGALRGRRLPGRGGGRPPGPRAPSGRRHGRGRVRGVRRRVVAVVLRPVITPDLRSYWSAFYPARRPPPSSPRSARSSRASAWSPCGGRRPGRLGGGGRAGRAGRPPRRPAGGGRRPRRHGGGAARRGRTDVYLYPGLALLVAVALDELHGSPVRGLGGRRGGGRRPGAGSRHAIYPPEDVRPLIAEIEDRARPDEVVLVYSATRWAYGLYTREPVAFQGPDHLPGFNLEIRSTRPRPRPARDEPARYGPRSSTPSPAGPVWWSPAIGATTCPPSRRPWGRPAPPRRGRKVPVPSWCGGRRRDPFQSVSSGQRLFQNSSFPSSRLGAPRRRPRLLLLFEQIHHASGTLSTEDGEGPANRAAGPRSPARPATLGE